ncbi:MAG: peptidase, partial [Treponema sp.]|nr:peptidase [Treponema sp.]
VVFLVALSASTLFAQDIRPDTLEPDSRVRRIPVQNESWITRTVHEKDEDWFSYTAPADGVLAAETESDFDTVLELFDGVSRVEVNDDISDKNTNSKLLYPVEAGVVYTVLVYGYEHAETGTYRIRFRLEQDPTEPNNTRARAFPLTTEAVTGYIYPSGDEDWYAVTVQSGMQLVYTTGNTDVLLVLYGENGEELASDDDSGGGGNALIKQDMRAGTCYIKVTGYETGTGRYDLHAVYRKPIPPDTYEDDDTPETAKAIQEGVPQQRTFSSSDDEDWARLRVTRGGNYEIGAAGFAENQDTYLAILNEAGEEIAADDDGGESFDASITVNLEPGIYYIRVTTFDQEPLLNYNYTLTVRSR